MNGLHSLLKAANTLTLAKYYFPPVRSTLLRSRYVSIR